MRTYQRFIVNEEVECWIDGYKDFVSLYDLSCGGCMIESNNFLLKPGREVRIELKDMALVRGSVVWRQDHCTGIRFETPLHPRMVEMLGFNGIDTPFESIQPRDRFGTSLKLFG